MNNLFGWIYARIYNIFGKYPSDKDLEDALSSVLQKTQPDLAPDSVRGCCTITFNTGRQAIQKENLTEVECYEWARTFKDYGGTGHPIDAGKPCVGTKVN